MTEPVTPQAKSRHAAIAERGREYVDTHYFQHPTLETVARAAGVGSKFHFHRIFMEAFGESSHDRAERMCLQETQRLLRDGLPSKVVARMAGYRNQSYFCQAFRRRLGITPARWIRLEMKKKAA